MTQDDRSPFRNQRWVECTGSNLGFGDCVEITDSIRVPETDGIRTVFEVETPTEDSAVNTIIIGHMEGAKGYCTNDFPAYAKCVSGAEVGEEVGPLYNSRILQKGQTGYIVMGDVSNGMARVRRSGGSAKTCYTISFKIVSADPENKTAVVAIQSRPPDCESVPEEITGDTTCDTGMTTSGPIVTVHDPAGCYLNEPAADLACRWGWAQYQTPVTSDAPEWQIFSLCCPTCDTPSSSSSSPSTGEEYPAMITGDGPGPIPGSFLP